MSWVAWRQQRLLLLSVLGVVVVAAGVMTYFRLDANAYLATNCGGQADCSGPAMDGFRDRYSGYTMFLRLAMLALPALVGMFAGGPLFARDFEQRTHVLSLTQSVGRTRWWATKLLVGGVPVVVMMLALGLVAIWAAEPMNVIQGVRLRTPSFETQGLVIGAYTLFGLTVGASAGLLFRSTLAAMALSVVLYVVALVAVGAQREHYLPPETVTTAVIPQGTTPYGPGSSGRASSDENIPEDSWRLAENYFDQHGNQVTMPMRCLFGEVVAADCPQLTGPITEVTSYHPGIRFWAFQSIESGIFAVLGAVVLALGWWRLRRRVL
ncbi:ABC transporter permease [Goodfellowiella coeruleoviolacea]|uniref:ABC-2 family transporter protein n=1 Tax=Goodfellowiella coeruleoviolacea TaxID=334858 RepID=A0AAE3GMB2_9PSEU|nr:ABC transporter permease [Goodfellowiella coeruleoviolacea]MCP2170024.1 ABC-2 family transporter protein [Goodfellowiella coeruleoviolacea]